MKRPGLHLAAFAIACFALAFAARGLGYIDAAIALAGTALCITTLFVWDELSNHHNRKTNR